MDNLAIAKEIIRENYHNADCGIFNTRNIMGDAMANVYSDNGLMIDICYNYSYFEVFGLTPNEFAELKEYYNSLSRYKEGDET